MPLAWKAPAGAVQGIVEAIGVVVPGKAAMPDEASPGTVGREGPSATGAVVGMACKLLAGSGGGGPDALAVQSAPPPHAVLHDQRHHLVPWQKLQVP